MPRPKNDPRLLLIEQIGSALTDDVRETIAEALAEVDPKKLAEVAAVYHAVKNGGTDERL